MNFNDRSTAAGIVGYAHKSGNMGVGTQGLGRASSDAIRSSLPAWVNPCSYDYVEGVAAPVRPKDWTDVDTFLSKTLGFRVKYDPVNFEKDKEKHVSRYASSLANQQIKIKGSDFSEADLLKGVSVIDTDCDLKQTTATALPDLKQVTCDLSLDASSPLRDLSNLKKIGGKLRVFAKNQEEMTNYLKELGLMAKDGSMLTSLKGDIIFIMKSYL